MVLLLPLLSLFLPSFLIEPETPLHTLPLPHTKGLWIINPSNIEVILYLFLET